MAQQETMRSETTGRSYPRRKAQKRIDKTRRQQAAKRARKGEGY